MQNVRNKNIDSNNIFRPHIILSVCLLIFFQLKSHAQNCPPNIDFENGTFNGWTCYMGSTAAAVNGQNEINLYPSGVGPMPDYHTMYSAAGNSGDVDYYGRFPVLCPNGSGFSVKLGNDRGGAEAEGLSYEFTIPANRNTYSLIYHYAVVFQDPNHLPFQQPRLVMEVTDVTSNELITCSSFTFFPNGSALPGFFPSPNGDTIAVWCKNWSAVTINLNGKAGKTIRLFFKTADCTFRRHFGYAYVDVNTECSNEFVGAAYCPDDTAVNITAPYGYQSYTWFNNTFSQVLGQQQIINFTPPPPVGTTIAVELIPFNGYGCLDTLYARLIDTLTIKAKAGLDMLSCNQDPVIIGENPKPGEVYSWSPATGLSDPNIANPRAGPLITTDYILTVRSTGGGCMSTDTVKVNTSSIDSSMQLIGNPAYCITSGDSAVLMVQPTDNIQWYWNNTAIPGANQVRYRVTQKGNYSAQLRNAAGCQLYTRIQPINIDYPVAGIQYPLQYAVMNSPLQLDARNFGATVLWRPSIYLDKATIINPIFNSPIDEDKLYRIEITTASGCVTVDTQLVKTIKEVKIFVPTAFTPNNDGLNDLLKPVTFGIKQLQYFRVYTRWGQMVYDMQPNSLGWNGKIKGIQQSTAGFVWTVQGIGVDNKIYRQKGTVVLIR